VLVTECESVMSTEVAEKDVRQGNEAMINSTMLGFTPGVIARRAVCAEAIP